MVSSLQNTSGTASWQSIFVSYSSEGKKPIAEYVSTIFRASAQNMCITRASSRIGNKQPTRIQGQYQEKPHSVVNRMAARGSPKQLASYQLCGRESGSDQRGPAMPSSSPSSRLIHTHLPRLKSTQVNTIAHTRAAPCIQDIPPCMLWCVNDCFPPSPRSGA